MAVSPKLNLLITGGCGFIGANLVNHLLQQGDYKIRILDNLSTGNLNYVEEVASNHGVKIIQINNADKGYQNRDFIEIIIGDIKDKSICAEASREVDTIVHLAAHAGVIPSIENPYHDFEINALGTLNLLHTSVKNDVKKFIFASSNAPLGDQSPPMNESKLPKPLSPYGASKLACEGYCSAFYNSYGLKTVSLRFSNAYGPYSLHKNSVIAKFIKDAITKRMLTIYGDGTQTRDFIHVDDLYQAISVILKSESLLLNPKIWGEIFHLGTGKESPILELARLVQGLFNEKIKIFFTSERKGEIKRNYSDITKAQKILGFSPKISLEESIKEVYEWFIKKDIAKIEKAEILSDSE